MDLAYIKFILRTLGITNLSVRFDDPNRQLITDFTYGGEKQQRLIAFSEIEDLFTESSAEALAGQPGHNYIDINTIEP